MERDTGGVAFPGGRRFEIGDGWQSEDGMTLRDYFAAKAMQSLLVRGGAFKGTEVMAYEIADAMIMERNK